MLDLNERFHRDGYVVLEDFFSAAEMAEPQRLLQEHFGLEQTCQFAENFRAAECEVISWDPAGEGVEAFSQLQRHPRLVSATEAVLGGPFEIMGSLIMCSPPQSAGQAWHQDCIGDNPAHFNLNRLVYTHDIGDNGGAVVVVPGSHRLGDLPTGEPHGDLEGQLELAPKAGTLVLLHGRTYHRVTPVHERPRISTNFRVVPAGSPTDITAIGIYRNMTYDFRTHEACER